MSSIAVGIRIPISLHERLEEYRAKANLGKSEVIISAIAQYLGAVEDIPFSHRVIDLEKRLATLEAEVQELKQ